MKYSFYANLITRVILERIAQFDSGEYCLKDHIQPKYEINTDGNGSSSTYITMKQRLLKYSIKTTYILCLKSTICISKQRFCLHNDETKMSEVTKPSNG